jgi:signal recognition particle subunit SRP54
MQQISQAINPTTAIFVLVGASGQAAHDQALAFKQKVSIGSVIITKLDGHAKGGGALSAVAATQSPIIFIGTGEHVDDLEPFVAKSFVSKLLGMGHESELIKRIKDLVPNDQQPQMMDRISQGIFTLRDMYDQFSNILKMGPLNKVMEMVPGMSNLLKQAPGGNVDSSYKIKMFMTIMDSMTNEELDNSKLFASKVVKDSRIVRIARGSGRSIKEVNELLDQFKHFEKVMAKLKGMKIPKNGQMAPRNLAQMTKMMPQGLVNQMGFGNIQNMMRSMGNMNLGE